jgi:Fur family transcriptional regulator, stress-responsive regulator
VVTVEPNAELRATGLRVTPGRRAVLELLTVHPHSSAEALNRMLRRTLPGMSVQSVHNVLADLTTARLLRRIEPAGSAALYERRIGDNHHHVVCTGCSAVADVDCVQGSAPCLAPNDTSGFAVSVAEVTFWGLCAACQDTSALSFSATNDKDIKEIVP